MYIEPRTNVRLLHNVPLENTYDHTLYFADRTSQYNYFANLTKKNCVNYTYQRVNKGRLRVEGKADNYYDCNYMMFQNTSFGDKWFYAFINSVEYVNNETTEIEFEIDVMQTWLFEADVQECFIERQHSRSDGIGENIVPETLECGEYIFNDYDVLLRTSGGMDMSRMVVCIALTFVTEGKTNGAVYNGVYGGSELYVYDIDDVEGINDFISDYIHVPDSIVSMYMFPKIFIGDIPLTHKLPSTFNGVRQYVNAVPVDKTMTLDGYKPKNAKMYTYPYNFYHIDNANGQSLSLRYEFFDNLQPTVEVSGTITQPVVATCRPDGYKGLDPYSELGGYHALNTEVIQIAGFPLCSWNYDSYKAWIAQNAIPLVLQGLTNVGQVAIGSNVASHPTEAMGMGAVSIVGSTLSQFYSASMQADMCKGNFNNGGVNVSIGKQQFYAGRCSVNYQYAKMIDDYFTMYGYAVKSIGRINTNARPHWNYVKTVGCVLNGSIPSDDARKIISIYDRGITFWKNGLEVGNYELDNTFN